MGALLARFASSLPDVKDNIWATVIAVAAAFGVAAFQIRYLAAPAGPSRESAATAIQELGQPVLMLECELDAKQTGLNQGAFLLTLRNVGPPLVSNITVPDIPVPMRDQIIRNNQEMCEAFPVEEASQESSLE